jgi:hypothetical protein
LGWCACSGGTELSDGGLGTMCSKSSLIAAGKNQKYYRLGHVSLCAALSVELFAICRISCIL